MPVCRDNIAEVIHCAWQRAHDKRHSICWSDIKDRNRKYSTLWVNSLAYRFREHYTGCRHRTFWRKNCENKTQFLLNEMLFDIAVCSVDTTTSLKDEPGFEFVAQCYWQVESEFDRRNLRRILVDMSKLVMGLAENKLFIAAHRIRANKKIDKESEAKVLCRCAKIARRCDGNVYFCFVAHPDDWEKACVPAPKLFKWDASCWECTPLPKDAKT